MGVRHITAILLSVLVLCSISGATPLYRWENENGNPRWGAVLTPYTPSTLAHGQKLSGTRVEVGVALIMESNPPPPETQQWKSRNFRVYLEQPGETQIWAWSAEQLECEELKFRFATTCKPDGADLKIRVRGEVRWNTTSPWVEVDETFVFQAYNKLHILGTDRTTEGQINPIIAAASLGIVQAAQLLTPEHTSAPQQAADALSELRSSILSKIEPSTVFVAASHGSPTYFTSSGAIYPIYFSGPDSPLVAPYVQGKAANGIPSYNFVALYSCRTIVGSSSEAISAYGLYGVNKGYGGFNDDLSPYVFSAADWALAQASNHPWPQGAPTETLGKHADWLFTCVQSEGTVLGLAVDAANAAYPPMVQTQLGWTQSPMQYIGDPIARLRYVYLDPVVWWALLSNDIDTRFNYWIMP